jgi:hypothetical protein
MWTITVYLVDEWGDLNPKASKIKFLSPYTSQLQGLKTSIL